MRRLQVRFNQVPNPHTVDQFAAKQKSDFVTQLTLSTQKCDKDVQKQGKNQECQTNTKDA